MYDNIYKDEINSFNAFKAVNKDREVYARRLEELKEFSNVEIITPYVPVKILGEDKVEGLIIKHRETGEEKTLTVDGFFPLVGQDPNTQFVNIEGVKDEWGTIPFDKTMATKVEGLYAAGDVLPRAVKQIYLSEHDGKVAAKSIIAYLNK